MQAAARTIMTARPIRRSRITVPAIVAFRSSPVAARIAFVRSPPTGAGQEVVEERARVGDEEDLAERAWKPWPRSSSHQRRRGEQREQQRRHHPEEERLVGRSNSEKKPVLRAA
jgi:hypothetical protein